MFGANHNRLKTNLKVAIQRLKLLEKKQSELARKSTKEIADFISQNKYDRARIKVEHIIREDYLVEGMEIVEMYCDLLLARFGLIESTKEVDPGLYEAIASIIWVTPRLESDVSELKQITEELKHKYGNDFVTMCRSNKCGKVNERLMLKMSEQAPGDLLVEKYLVEITKSHNVPFKPDPSIAVRDPDFFYSKIEEPPSYKNTHNHNNHNNNSGSDGGSGGGSQAPNDSALMTKPIYPSTQQVSYIGFTANQPVRPPSARPKPAANNNSDDIELPRVPDGKLTDSFDELEARFNNLKKK